MRAEIDEYGGLAIIAETPVELFALRIWFDELKSTESVYSIRLVDEIEERE